MCFLTVKLRRKSKRREEAQELERLCVGPGTELDWVETVVPSFLGMERSLQLCLVRVAEGFPLFSNRVGQSWGSTTSFLHLLGRGANQCVAS